MKTVGPCVVPTAMLPPAATSYTSRSTSRTCSSPWRPLLDVARVRKAQPTAPAPSHVADASRACGLLRDWRWQRLLGSASAAPAAAACKSPRPWFLMGAESCWNKRTSLIRRAQANSLAHVLTDCDTSWSAAVHGGGAVQCWCPPMLWFPRQRAAAARPAKPLLGEALGRRLLAALSAYCLQTF